MRRTCTRAYFDAKADAGREKRLAWMLDRLDGNLKPMWQELRIPCSRRA